MGLGAIHEVPTLSTVDNDDQAATSMTTRARCPTDLDGCNATTQLIEVEKLICGTEGLDHKKGDESYRGLNLNTEPEKLAQRLTYQIVLGVLESFWNIPNIEILRRTPDLFWS